MSIFPSGHDINYMTLYELISRSKLMHTKPYTHTHTHIGIMLLLRSSIDTGLKREDYVYVCLRVYACACVRRTMCVHACVCMCESVWAYGCMSVYICMRVRMYGCVWISLRDFLQDFLWWMIILNYINDLIFGLHLFYFEVSR